MHSLPKKLLQRLVLLGIALFTAGMCRAEWLSETRPIMGTQVSVELWSTDPEQGLALQQAVLAEFQRLDEMMNPWNEQSLLSQVNREGFDKAVAVTPELIEVVQRSLYYSQLSNGAFDISFAAAGQHYDFREGRAPSSVELEKASAAIDFRQILVDPAAQTLRLERAGMSLDLGGIAKGYAVDRAIEMLLAAGIESAVVSAGGDSRILGSLGDRPRMIGIRHPRKEGEYAVVIPLADTAISTSGDYERFFERDGVRFHHILDPETGKSARAVRSASVIAPYAIDTDALSTTVFVLGVKKGLALVNGLPGVDAIIVDGDGRLHYSDELLLSTKD